MFKGDFADKCGEKFPLVSMGEWAGSSSLRRQGARIPIDASETLSILVNNFQNCHTRKYLREHLNAFNVFQFIEAKQKKRNFFPSQGSSMSRFSIQSYLLYFALYCGFSTLYSRLNYLSLQKFVFVSAFSLNKMWDHNSHRILSMNYKFFWAVWIHCDAILSTLRYGSGFLKIHINVILWYVLIVGSFQAFTYLAMDK